MSDICSMMVLVKTGILNNRVSIVIFCKRRNANAKRKHRGVITRFASDRVRGFYCNFQNTNTKHKHMDVRHTYVDMHNFLEIAHNNVVVMAGDGSTRRCRSSNNASSAYFKGSACMFSKVAELVAEIVEQNGQKNVLKCQ